MKHLALPLALLLVSGLTPGTAAAAGSQATTYDVQMMTFDMWCQGTQQYPFERCEARHPEDLKAFDDYRKIIESYEIQYLQQRDADEALRQRLSNHEADNPNATRVPTPWPH